MKSNNMTIIEIRILLTQRVTGCLVLIKGDLIRETEMVIKI